ncbi:hypothetical protein INT43_005503 [Umbelopsis isabellina]|uniref:tRNA-binding domain-containing protein n=1 Tax=Mortierella isabellina TaxID=91625 RepID=A0A8H7PMQ5_MORIS|nr:hypothetical protein INT43_005503 [Umbelopsis isabellina]
MPASQKATLLVQAYTGNTESSQDVKTLVAKKPELLGTTPAEKSEVDSWIAWTEKVFDAAGCNIEEALETLDKHLKHNTYIAGNNFTVADIASFADVHTRAEKIAVTTYPNVLRWIDLIQNIVVKGNATAEKEFPLIALDLENVPEPVITVALTIIVLQKKDKKSEVKAEAAAAGAAAAATATAAAAAVTDAVVPDKKKEKKAKKEKKEKAPPAPAAPEQPVVSRLDIRVGHIVSCKKHEDADALYVEQIDVGDPEGVPRTIVSGLVKWYPVEEMQNRIVLVLCNLKPANMRGVKSQGMVLCASPADGTKVELLAPVDLTKVKPGDRVYFEGMEGTPENVLNPKKKYWETVQPDFKTNGETVAYFQDKPFLIKSSSGEDIKVKAATVTEGLIR